MKQRGFSFIELIIFIIVLGIIAVAFALPFQQVFSKKTFDIEDANLAATLAETRINLILSQKKELGFNNFTDACSASSCSQGAPCTPAVCTPPAGYTVTATITTFSFRGRPAYKLITVSVTGTAEATLKTLVSRFF